MLIDLPAIGCAERTVQAASVGSVGLGGIGTGRATPRDAIRVGAAISVIAVTALDSLLAAEFERGETRLRADGPRDHLIHRHSGLDVLAERLLGMHAGEVGGTGAAVI